MQALNLRAVERDGSGYVRQELERTSGGRKIHRFILTDSQAAGVLQAAATSIINLLADNPHLICVSPPDNGYTEKLKACRYLVINGHALCITDKDKAPNHVDVICRDIFFSEGLIDNPVQCPHGHTFEEEYALNWLRLNGDRCPHMGQHHEIGALEHDDYLLERVQSLLEAHGHQASINSEAVKRIERAEANALVQSVRITDIESVLRPGRTVEACGGSGKLAVKINSALMIRQSTGTGAKAAGEFTVVAFGKKVPVLSVLLAICLAGYRCYQAHTEGNNLHYVKAVGELGSGFASCFPGLGTGVAIVIDGVMLGHDVYEMNYGKLQGEIDVDNARKTLGLDSIVGQPSQQQIDDAFRQMSRLTHPDRMRQYGQFNQQMLNDLQVTVTRCRDRLYKAYGY